MEIIPTKICSFFKQTEKGLHHLTLFENHNLGINSQIIRFKNSSYKPT